jgi:putative nucleotidyltransferase with HDIG domain
LFVLIGISQLSLPETLAMGCLGVLVKCFLPWETRPRAIQIAFNVGSMACSIAGTFYVYDAAHFQGETFEVPFRLLLAAATFFVTSTLSYSDATALAQGRRTWSDWRESSLRAFPNYIAGAAVAWIAVASGELLGWQTSLLLLPALYIACRSHRMYIESMEEEKKRSEEYQAFAKKSAPLHRRMIDLLALAVEAKDQTTHAHLERVELYAMAVGRECGLNDDELEALHASALLHDIGKLAVPEYIISKPGKLSPAEFEKMKTHTVVGAEIVEQIHLPYPVAPIVRSHHERWDGCGYPDGLSGEQIPIGARILSAVDCLDALASDRQYRRALPLNEAIKIIEAEAGKAFDPGVVAILKRRCIELEQAAARQPHEKPKLSTNLRVMRGAAPAAGFESTNGTGSDLINLCNSFAHEEKLAGCKARDAALSTFLASVRKMIPCDLLVFYRKSGETLIPECLDGEDFQQFSLLAIPLGRGLSGWVAENAKSIVNGNPSVEPGYSIDPATFGRLHSALAIPLEAHGSVTGVLSLYRREPETFTSEDLARLSSLGSIAAKAFDLSEPADRDGI